MDTMNEETPQQDESQTQPPVEETAPASTTEVPAEATEANETDATDETPAEPTVEGADVQASAPETEDDEEETETFTAPIQPQAVDIQQFIDVNGNLDAVAFNAAQAAQMQAAVNAAVQQSANERKYEKTWERAYEAYPELKKNKDLRNMVQAIHANSPTTGKYLSPKQAAEKFFGFAGAAKQQGIKAAQQTRTTQAAAGLGVTGAQATAPSNKVAQLRDKMHNGLTLKDRQDANKALLEELITTGAV